MKRDLAALVDREYDIVVIGGGISGACVAWDAALRGLSVALVERGDFGHATSANSLKIVHGGLRYIRDGDLGLVRKMIRERAIFMRIAPNLVLPLPCVMPTYRDLTRNRLVMGTALALTDLLGIEYRHSQGRESLPKGQIISKQECLELLPGLASEGVTGGIVWHDCQMYNSERLTLSFVLSAAETGAQVANYVEAIGFLRNGRRIKGVKARDVLSGESFDIRGKIVINTAGPWVNCLLDQAGASAKSAQVHFSSAMNLLTRQVIPGHAAGLRTTVTNSTNSATEAKRSRLLFMTPWRDYSLVGTTHDVFDGYPDDFMMGPDQVKAFLEEINQAYPGAELTQKDVYQVYAGLLPMHAEKSTTDNVKLVRRGLIFDHSKRDGIDGLVTLVGVKYTAAREMAENAVDLVVKKLGCAGLTCLTRVTPLYGGQMESFDLFLSHEMAKRPLGLSEAGLYHLIRIHGSSYRRVLKHIEIDSARGETIEGSSETIKAEILHAVREEMALTLADVVFRRTELGTARPPTEESLQACGRLMASELGWSRQKMEREIQQVRC